jgi:glycosyltransferase involved in cell wall biosynthesis
LPRSFYGEQYFENVPANVSFNCVSGSQAHDFSGLARMEGMIANGIALDLFGQASQNHRSRDGLLWLGRICEEKAPHLALDIAASSGLRLTLAGQVYPFSYHQQYFDREIAPRLQRNPKATFVPLPCHHRKRQLFAEARAVVITSRVDETSSLVAMEAAASGTPVIAFARGALREIVQHGLTGFLVDDVEAAVAAVERLTEIDPAACLRHACEHFSSARMADGYARLYGRILRHRAKPRIAANEREKTRILKRAGG